MLIRYKQFDPFRNEVVNYVILNVDHCQCSRYAIFYWKVGQPRWMYRLNLSDISDVRIENETKS